MKPFFVEKNILNETIITIDNPSSQLISVSGCLNGVVNDTALILITPFNNKMTEPKHRPTPVQINLTIDAGTFAKIESEESFFCAYEKIEIYVICSAGASVDLALNGGSL